MKTGWALLVVLAAGLLFANTLFHEFTIDDTPTSSSTPGGGCGCRTAPIGIDAVSTE